MSRAVAWHFLASWLGEGPPPDVEPPYDLISRIAYRHRLEPLLGCVALPETVPVALARRFHQAAAAARAEQIARFGKTRAVLEVLRDWPVVVFKGFPAAELLYPDVGARSMGDVDLLVRPADFEMAYRALLAAGFRNPYAGDAVLDHPTHHERELSDGELVVDLHQGFTQLYRLPLDYPALFARSLPWTALSPNARLLSADDAVLAQAIHLGIGELTPQAAPIIGVCDLRLMLLRQSPFWGGAGGAEVDMDQLLALAASCGASRMLYASLSFASALFPSIGSAVPRGLLLGAGVRALLDRVVARALPPAISDPARVEQLWRKAVLLPPGARWALLTHQTPLWLRYLAGIKRPGMNGTETSKPPKEGA
jgi:hypothetical protein